MTGNRHHAFIKQSHSRIVYCGLAAAVALLLGSAVQAETSSHTFVLTAYSNGRGGAELMSGNYAAAAEALHSQRAALRVGPEHDQQQPLRGARHDQTVGFRPHRLRPGRTRCPAGEGIVALLPVLGAQGCKNDYLALALSNRAVLHWMSADSGGRGNDLKRAESLSPEGRFRHAQPLGPGVLAAHPALAQVSVAPSCTKALANELQRRRQPNSSTVRGQSSFSSRDKRAVRENPPSGLAARAIVGLVLGVADALHRRAAHGAGLAETAVHRHLGPERVTLSGKSFAAPRRAAARSTPATPRGWLRTGARTPTARRAFVSGRWVTAGAMQDLVGIGVADAAEGPRIGQ